MKRALWCAYALTIGYASHILAAEIAPGTPYTGPTTLDVRQLGLSFTLPQGWVGALQGDSFLVGSHTIGGFVILSADKMTVDDAKVLLSQPQDLGDGYILYPQGTPQTTSGTVRVNCLVTDGSTQLDGRVHVKVGKHGVGLAIVAVAPSRQLGPVAQAADAIEQSVTFKKPAVPRPSPLKGEWKAQLAGVKIIRFYTGSGYREKEYYNFCPNGTFYRVFEAGGFTPNVASGAFLDENGGTWSAAGTLDNGQVTLRYRNGTTHVLTVAIQHEKLMVDGQRWLRDRATCN